MIYKREVWGKGNREEVEESDVPEKRGDKEGIIYEREVWGKGNRKEVEESDTTEKRGGGQGVRGYEKRAREEKGREGTLPRKLKGQR